VKPNENNKDIDLNSFKFFQKIEKSLAAKLGLTELKSGIQIIRDNNGWRENEKSIRYIWIVTIARSFVGWGGVFSIQFNENKFRDLSNQEELIQGTFILNNDSVDQIYTKRSLDATYNITQFFKLNLFEANKGINTDGVSYNVKIIAPNIDTFIQLNNPNTDEWKKWETEIWTMGKKLARESNDKEMINLFE
jgi:hypothetical protein